MNEPFRLVSANFGMNMHFAVEALNSFDGGVWSPYVVTVTDMGGVLFRLPQSSALKLAERIGQVVPASWAPVNEVYSAPPSKKKSPVR
jgi:hypothetical protein